MDTETMSDMAWPSSKIAQGAIAIAGSVPLTVVFAYLSIPLSASFFDREYPHDGQNGLGVLFVAIVVLVLTPIPAAVGLYGLQQWLLNPRPRWDLKSTGMPPPPSPSEPHPGDVQ